MQILNISEPIVLLRKHWGYWFPEQHNAFKDMHLIQKPFLNRKFTNFRHCVNFSFMARKMRCCVSKMILKLIPMY